MTPIEPETPADPIRKTVTVPLDRHAAFELFTAGIDRWWPKDSHSLSAREHKGADASVRVEPRVGGRVLERLPDGTEAPWATVTDWRPGERLGLSWYVGHDAEEATTIDVTFTQSEAGTRVDLTHAGFGVFGAGAAELCASYTTGWGMVLETRFAQACSAVPA